MQDLILKHEYDGWEVVVNSNGEVVVTKCRESREYTIPEEIKSIEATGEYIYVNVEGKFYQFKLEMDNFLVGDIFDTDGELIEEYACHVFGEEEEE
jgi:hypothetical protein